MEEGGIGAEGFTRYFIQFPVLWYLQYCERGRIARDETGM